jgi:threonine dehydratase
LDTGNRRVYLKIESDLPTGSFKVRGAVYAMSRHAERNGKTPVIAASTGNHGAAVAYAGRLLNVPVTIFLPERANPIKTRRILDLGARLVATGPDLSAAIDAAYAEADRTGAFFLHDATDPDIPVGTATIGTEIVTQLPAVEAMFVPMGDTALIRGVATAAKQLKPSIRIVGVAAANAPAYFLSWRGGEAVSTETADTIADGLAVRRALAPNVAAITSLVDDVRLVQEEDLLAAMTQLMALENVIAEPAAAAATAALMKDSHTTGTIVALVTGKNAAPELVERLQRNA